MPVRLVSSDNNVDILHKFRKAGKRWMIYDMEIEGVSILLTYRSQFRDILNSVSVEEFLSRLAEPPSR